MKIKVNNQFESLRDFITQLNEGNFNFSGVIVHYGRNCVKVFSEQGKKIVVKKYKRPNFFNRVTYTFFRGSKARRAYENAIRLKQMSVNTPVPCGYVDVKQNGLVHTSYLVTEYTDYRPVADIFEGEEDYRKHPLFDEFVRFTVRLHELGIKHRDFHLSNVLYKELPFHKYEFMLIDINRMDFGHMTKRECLVNIKRICTNAELVFEISKRYSEIRGWDPYICMAEVAIQRFALERKKLRKSQFKDWVKSAAKA